MRPWKYARSIHFNPLQGGPRADRYNWSEMSTPVSGREKTWVFLGLVITLLISRSLHFTPVITGFWAHFVTKIRCADQNLG